MYLLYDFYSGLSFYVNIIKYKIMTEELYQSILKNTSPLEGILVDMSLIKNDIYDGNFWKFFLWSLN